MIFFFLGCLCNRADVLDLTEFPPEAQVNQASPPNSDAQPLFAIYLFLKLFCFFFLIFFKLAVYIGLYFSAQPIRTFRHPKTTWWIKKLRGREASLAVFHINNKSVTGVPTNAKPQLGPESNWKLRGRTQQAVPRRAQKRNRHKTNQK